MPKYRVTTDVGEGAEPDDEPMEFETHQAACHDAQVALAEMAKERMPLDRDRHFGVEIHDDAGQSVYSASLDFKTGARADPAGNVGSQLPSGPRE